MSKNMSNNLAAQSLNEDPRVKQAKRLLLDALQDHQNTLTSVRPPNPDLKVEYQKLLEEYASMRGGKLWYPYIGSGIGRGALVELLDGSVKYDFICGIGPHYFGHSHPEIVNSSIDAALSNTIMQGHLQQNMDSIELTRTLLKLSKLDHCFLTTSGAMANENALKLAFHKKFPAKRILAFEHCFVGRTLTISQITDKPNFREGLPSQIYVDYVPFFDGERPEESISNAVAVLKKYLRRHPKEYAVMCFELVQGEGGFYAGSKEFFKTLMTLLKDHGVAIFDDEVQSFGRLPELFAFQYYGLENLVDLVSIGKLSQVCATLFTEEFKPKPGLLGQTFTGSTSAIRGTKVMLNYLLENNFYGANGKIAQLYQYTTDKLKALSKNYPHLIRGPFGIGCMIGFTPLDGSQQKVVAFAHALFEAGVICFIAGENPTRVRFLIPAGAVTYDDIDQAIKIVEETLKACYVSDSTHKS